MFKKTLISLGVVLLLTFASCGGGSSKEAQELLQKILTVIGIPPGVITNICQTSNSSDMCEGLKLNKLGNSESKTWQKITETGEGQYLIETTKPCEPILVKLQDDDVEYDSGEFFLKFSGVEYGKTSKELSILEAMVDATYLSSSSVGSIKTLNNADAQNSFYATLYRDLKTNINILRTTGLTQTQSIRGTLKEMADELLSYGVNSTLPNTLNSCNEDTTCIQKELDRLSSKLLIDSSESVQVYNTQNSNTSALTVREVSCEEPKKSSNKFLNKTISYNNDNIKTDEGQFIYENNRLKESLWKSFEDEYEDWKWIYEYSPDMIKISVDTHDLYWEERFENGLLAEVTSHGEGINWNQKIVERDNQNRATKIEERSDDENKNTLRSLLTYRYDGEYMVHYEDIDQDPEYYDTTEYYDYTYNREHRCITIEDLTGQVSLGWTLDEEVCINWISKTITNKRDNSSDTETQEITYNNDGLPNRIDTYDKDNEHTYTIFEYAN